MNFTNVIKDLEMGEIILDYPDGPNVNLRVFTGGRQENHREKRSERKEAEVGGMHFEDEGRGYDPKNKGSFLKLEKARTLILSHSL